MSRLNILYASTMFLSAFLMFSVQPMIAKTLLPLLGGSTSVWTLAMLFFQILLLGGYLYAHLLARIPKIQVQGIIHAALVLGAGALSLPLLLDPSLDNLDLGEPMAWQLQTMAVMIAAPFFVLASTAPLLQRWFSLSDAPDAGSPYKLYAASNAGSLLALLAYPFVVERMASLDTQGQLWTYGYVALLAGLVIAFLVSRFSPAATATTDEAGDTAPSWKKRAVWIFLAFCPSSLMLGFTTFVTTDVAAVPLLWVLPLALYLLTFIIAFAEKQVISLTSTRSVHAIFILVYLWMEVAAGNSQLITVLIHTGIFFFTALLCHQELSAQKPSPRHLTDFYLCLSVGGALGGIFNSLIAPVIFTLPYEYALVIGLSLFARFIGEGQTLRKAYDYAVDVLKNKVPSTWMSFALFPGLLILGVAVSFTDSTFINTVAASVVVLMAYIMNERRWAFALTAVVIIFFHSVVPTHTLKSIILVKRNFYGVHRITEDETMIRMMHGTTVHGAQSKDPDLQNTPIGYYFKNSGIGDAFFSLDQRKGPQSVAVLGLGTGSVACYHREGRHFDFYEIDQDIADIAENPRYFSYLKNCGTDYSLKIGDARREILKAPDNSYDLILVDVFSSDNVPVHVITKEAVELYLQKLKLDGILIFHVSNRFFTLENELGDIGKSISIPVMLKVSPDGTIGVSQTPYFANKYVVITRDQGHKQMLKNMGWLNDLRKDARLPWTDRYADVLRSLRLRNH